MLFRLTKPVTDPLIHLHPTTKRLLRPPDKASFISYHQQHNTHRSSFSVCPLEFLWVLRILWVLFISALGRLDISVTSSLSTFTISRVSWIFSLHLAGLQHRTIDWRHPMVKKINGAIRQEVRCRDGNTIKPKMK